jgi:hypothetical protein
MSLPGRCGKCPNCQHILKTQSSLLGSLERNNVRNLRLNRRESIGDDARVIWNDTLNTFPCADPSNLDLKTDATQQLASQF